MGMAVMTFVIKIRGVPTPTTFADYLCDEHGRFELEVKRTEAGDAPDFQPCPFDLEPCGACGDCLTGSPCGENRGKCDKPAQWVISAPFARVRLVEAVKGKWQKSERSTWTDTTNIMDGQPLHEWKEDRDKVWEERRKQDVYNFARMHNERVIGGD
jgi:hypothetical protein